MKPVTLKSFAAIKISTLFFKFKILSFNSLDALETGEGHDFLYFKFTASWPQIKQLSPQLKPSNEVLNFFFGGLNGVVSLSILQYLFIYFLWIYFWRQLACRYTASAVFKKFKKWPFLSSEALLKAVNLITFLIASKSLFSRQTTQNEADPELYSEVEDPQLSPEVEDYLYIIIL